MRTRELCEIAVNNGGAREDVPDALKTREVCIAALRQSSWMLAALEKAGIDLEKDDMQAIWNVVIAQEGSFLKCAPLQNKTEDLCLAAVQNDDRALEYVPEKLKTPELCLAAVQENGGVLKYVPEALKAQVKKAAGLE